jgi:ribosomal protein S18 acetylase RimI-like enzyme
MKQADPEIRRAKLEDATAITRCIAAAYRHYAVRIGKPPAPMLDDYAELIQRHKVFILAERDKIIGVLVLIEKEQSILLDNVAVNPKYQRRGLGRKLIEFAEAEALRLGFSSMILYTNVQMTENIDLYRKLGFVETGRKQEHGYQRIYMQRHLLEKRIVK